MSDELRATVLHSYGTWVAKCPRPWCVNADHYGPGPNTGRVGGLTRDSFHCFRCGLSCPADWPANPVDIEQVLAQRPFKETRNWRPGETLEDLLVENAAHGLLDADGLIGGMLAVGGHLTEFGQQLVASGPGPLAIGA